MLKSLLPPEIYLLIASQFDVSQITEIRIRLGHAVLVEMRQSRQFLMSNGISHKATRADIEHILLRASDYSVYAIDDEIARGYIPYFGLRIGVAGEGVVVGEKLVSQKNISFLSIRIPHQIFDCADKVVKEFGGDTKSTLVVSPPGAGKTTMLRELARIASKTQNTLIIDERFEIASYQNYIAKVDVGDCDIVSGIKKDVVYQNIIRAMNPDVVVVDELFGASDVACVSDCIRSGVKVFASVHADGIDSLKSHADLGKLLDCFELAVVLSKTELIGKIESIVAL